MNFSTFNMQGRINPYHLHNNYIPCTYHSNLTAVHYQTHFQIPYLLMLLPVPCYKLMFYTKPCQFPNRVSKYQKDFVSGQQSAAAASGSRPSIAAVIAHSRRQLQVEDLFCDPKADIDLLAKKQDDPSL